MKIKKLIASAAMFLLWVTLATGLGMAAFFAVQFSAISFHYYYGQHKLLEEVTTVRDPSFANPALEGRLVLAQGMVCADSLLRDPIYGVTAKAVHMSRRVTCIPVEEQGAAALTAPLPPPEPHLAPWQDCAPAHLGAYRLEGALGALPLAYGERPVLSVMSLPKSLRDEAEIDRQSLVMPSVNGFRYRVKFVLGKETEVAYLGRQRGETLVADNATEWRRSFMEEHQQRPLLLALLNMCFFLLPAWGMVMLALHALNKATGGEMALPELAWYGLLLSCVAWLSLYGICVEQGVLWNNPTFTRYPWSAMQAERFIPRQLEEGRVAVAQMCLRGGTALCVALALLSILRTQLLRRRAKQA